MWTGQGPPSFDREKPTSSASAGGWASSGGGTPNRAGNWESAFPRQQGVCNNWRREGRCSFGDRCKFLHELPVAELESRQEASTDGSFEKRLPQTPEEKSKWAAIPDAQRPWREREGPKEYYKTKLCEKFLSLGRCPYDDRCTYAHGYEELRPYPRHSLPTDTFPQSEVGDKDASECQSVTSDKPRMSQTQSEPLPFQSISEITYLDKVKAICSCVGIGNPGPLKTGAMQEAIADVKSKALLEGNVYADDVRSFV